MKMDINYDFGANAHFAFGKFDRVTIQNLSLRWVSTNEKTQLFQYADGSGLHISFTHEELSAFHRAGHLKREVDAFAPEVLKTKIFDKENFLTGIMGPAAKRLDKRESLVTVVEGLRAQGKLKLTEDSIRANLKLIRVEALDCADDAESRRSANPSETFAKMPHPSTILRWVRNARKHGRAALVDNFYRRGNKYKAGNAEVTVIVGRAIRERYLTKEQPTIKAVYDEIRAEIRQTNKDLPKDAAVRLRAPSYSTFARMINELDPYHVALLRFGADEARKNFKPVSETCLSERPMQRVEIDQVTLDLMTLMKAHHMFGLTPEECANLGLDGKKARWHLTVAICHATRCIVGMKLSRTDNQAAALTDKGEWIDGIGSTGVWNMFGLPEEIVTDCGSAFIAAAFRRAASDLGIITTRSVAGVPELRGTIERFFGSLNTGLITRLTGRTFSDVVSKADNNPELRTALTADDLCFALTRWIVDIYHNTPHRGLKGETPVQCWRRLSKEWGVSCPPGMGDMRLVFGERLQRVVSRQGVVVLGVRYHSVELAQWFLRNTDHKVDVRWHPKEIGTILVHLAGKWVAVPSVQSGLDGMHAQTWLSAMRGLKASFPRQTEFEADAIDNALMAISERVKGSKLTAKLLVESWSPERIAAEEARLFMNFTVKGNQRQAYAASMDGMVIEGTPLPEGVAEAAKPRKRKAAAQKYQMED